MLDQIFIWLEKRQYRWHVVHVVLITAILSMVDYPPLMTFVGCLALALLALLGASSVKASLRKISLPLHPFDLALICLPGAFAFLMAAGGLWLAAHMGLKWVGLPIFGLHAALLSWIASDHLDPRETQNNFHLGQ